MAGNYPDVLSWRMAYDLDGTQVYSILTSLSSVVQLSGSYVTSLNAENAAPIGHPENPQGAYYITFIFPELRDIDGWYIGQTNHAIVGGVSVSSDTTNGADGTWVSLGNTLETFSGKPSFREDISYSTALGVKGVRVRYDHFGGASVNTLFGVHLYGEPSTGENLQRLEIWHPTLDQRLGPADLDWGDVPRNTTETRQFRIKNMDPALTANNVRAAMSIITDTSPSVVGQMAISKDGSTWGAQQTLSSPLGPGDISPILYHRRTTPSNATLSLWWYRLFADCSSWT